MTTTKPTITKTLQALLQADFASQMKNYRSLMLTVLVPVIILIAWHKALASQGATSLMSLAITIGILGIGITSYPLAIARDRDQGIFQRLRVTPTPTWAIMASRIIIQLLLCVTTSIVVLAAGYILFNVHPSLGGIILVILVTIVSGAMYLAVGQIVVALIKSAETINSTARFIYAPILIVGLLGETGTLGDTIKQIVIWSPFGTVKAILDGAMNPGTWSNSTWLALLITIVYAVIFAGIGIKKFQWESR